MKANLVKFDETGTTAFYLDPNGTLYKSTNFECTDAELCDLRLADTLLDFLRTNNVYCKLKIARSKKKKLWFAYWGMKQSSDECYILGSGKSMKEAVDNLNTLKDNFNIKENEADTMLLF